MRIGRLLSHLGLCSRRAADEFLNQHHVAYRGQKITRLDFKIDTGSLAQYPLVVDGKEHKGLKQTKVYLLNKPPGYNCSHRRFKDRPVIFDLLPAEVKNNQRLFFAGRLDANSHGLVVLSTDGDLIYKLTHPSQQQQKVYILITMRPMSPAEQKQAVSGIYDHGEKLKFSKITPLSKPAHYRVTLYEGKNREIRRVISKLNNRVKDLQRIEHGPYKLADIGSGKFVEAEVLLS